MGSRSVQTDSAPLSSQGQSWAQVPFPAQAQRESSQKLEGQLDRFIDEALSPMALAGMVAGSLTYGALRLATFSRLARSAPGLWSRGLGAHLTASTVGFGGEVGAFVGTGRGLHWVAGQEQDWRLGALIRETAGTAMMLGALKITGAGSRFLLGRLTAASPWQNIPRILLPQAGMLLGIMGAHQAEESLGWRPESAGTELLGESLATLLHFNVAGKLVEGVMGPRYHALQRDLNLHSETWRAHLSQSMRGLVSPPLAVGLHLAAAGTQLRFPVGASTKAQNFMMEGDQGEGKGKGDLEDLGHRKTSTLRSPLRPPQRPASPPPPPEEHRSDHPSYAQTMDAEDMARMPSRIPAPKAPQGMEAEGQAVESEPLGSSPTDSQVSTSPLPAKAQTFSNAPFSGGVSPGMKLAQGKYTVLRSIGKGGFGEVFLIKDNRFQRDLVMKVLRSDKMESGLEDQGDRDEFRFKQEIMIGAHLDRRYNVTVYDLVELPNGQTVPVMEYVPGHDLATLLFDIHRSKRAADFFPLEKQIDIFAKICEAVEATHQAGVIHRDLKPDNIRVRIQNMTNMQESGVLLMDYGIAKLVGEESETLSGRTIPPEAARKISTNRYSTVGIMGTPVYMAPEAFALVPLAGRNPRSRDIYALGVILYEWLSGVHPFARFHAGDPARGEPAMVAEKDPEGYTEFHPMGVVDYKSPTGLAGVHPPSFKEIAAAEKDPVYYELEHVARKAMSPRPEDRYQSAAEMRQAVLMARAKVEKRRFEKLQEEIAQGEREMVEASPEQRIPEDLMDEMAQKEESLRELKAEWRNKGNEILFYLNQIMGTEPWPEAKAMVAEISWQRLLDAGDRLPERVRKTWEDRVVENDVQTPERLLPSMKLALTSYAYSEITVKDLAGKPVDPQKVLIKVTALERERDGQGRETGNYQESSTVIVGDPRQLSEMLHLKNGYYVFEVHSPGYAPMRVPVQVGLQDLKRSFEEERPLNLEFELVPQEMVPEDMLVVHRSRATIGHNFYQDGDLFSAMSFPEREYQFLTFAVSRDMVSVGKYKEFIEDLLANSTDLKEDLPRIRELLPRTTQPEAARRSASKFKTVLNRALNRTETYYWEIKTEGLGKNRKAFLVDPTSHLDPFEDPISLDQPISAISYKAAEEYRRWRAEKEGKPYRVVRAEEMELFARNSFTWKFPWGNGPLKRSYVVSYSTFENKEDAFPQTIGTNPLGESRDHSLYGHRDLLGNVREFTSTYASKNVIFLFGGSLRFPSGPSFNPTARNVQNVHTVVDAIGGFRLALDLHDMAVGE